MCVLASIYFEQPEILKITLKIGVGLDIYHYSSTYVSDSNGSTTHNTNKHYQILPLIKCHRTGVTAEKSMRKILFCFFFLFFAI